MNPVYAVRVGHAPGIYYDLAAYEQQLNGFPGAEGRKFKTLEEAQRYLDGEDPVKKGIYAVRVGRVPGIYHTLAECDAQVRGYEGAQSKRFATLEAAERYMNKRPHLKRSVKNRLAHDKIVVVEPPEKNSPPAPYEPQRERPAPLKKPPVAIEPPKFKAPPARGPLRRPTSRHSKHHPGAASPLTGTSNAGGDLIIIYTDGGCLVREDSAGGYAAVICLPNGNRKEISGGVAATTSDRMELLAAVSALRALREVAGRGAHVRIYTDSRYLIDGCRHRIWQERKDRPAPLQNHDLWAELAGLTRQYRIEWCWVKGHSGNPLNERCDFLATAAAKRSVAEKEFVPDYVGQLEDAKRQIKDLSRKNHKLNSENDRYQFLARHRAPKHDKDLYGAVNNGSLLSFIKWKLKRMFRRDER